MAIENLLIKAFLFLTISSVTLAATIDQVQQIPKLPLYIGKGYNILFGNPASNVIDPGFSHEIFQFNYNNHVTTEDGKYLLPDQVSHRKTSSCSFTTEISQYRGTESYQNELKTKAQVGGSYKGLLWKASFSSSVNYQKMKNQTISHNQTITHASAQCQSYQMSLNLFKPGKISQNFWQGVNYSYHANSWDKFIVQFGTHFVYELVLGGRAIQEIQYDWKSVSEMETIGVDINIAAKAKFASFVMDSSFDYKSHEQQIKYAQTLSKNIQQYYIGGQTPRTGHISDWHQKVDSNPMPITYKVLPLSDLFEFNPDKTINVDSAKTKFLQALDKYCQQNNCKQPQPDKPRPPPAKVTIQKTQSFGGGGGGDFDFRHPHPLINLHKVFIRCGKQIDRIQIQLSDGVDHFISGQYGGNGGGDQTPWEVPAGQYVHQVEFRSGDRVDSLTFVTNKGTRSPRYGGSGGGYHLLTLPEGFRIIGIFGRSGQRLDDLGFVVGKTQFNSSTGQYQVIQQNLMLKQN